jgi:hypothetical protein
MITQSEANEIHTACAAALNSLPDVTFKFRDNFVSMLIGNNEASALVFGRRWTFVVGDHGKVYVYDESRRRHDVEALIANRRASPSPTPTTNRYTIVNCAGHTLGPYRATDERAALEVLADACGYASFLEWSEVLDLSPEEHRKGFSVHLIGPDGSPTKPAALTQWRIEGLGDLTLPADDPEKAWELASERMPETFFQDREFFWIGRTYIGRNRTSLGPKHYFAKDDGSVLYLGADTTDGEVSRAASEAGSTWCKASGVPEKAWTPEEWAGWVAVGLRQLRAEKIFRGPTGLP